MSAYQSAAPAVQQTDKPSPPPPFGTPRMAAPDGPLPRVVAELERAPKGTVRFKAECRNYEAVPTQYVLAADAEDAEKQAEEHYKESSGVAAQARRLEKTAGKKNVAEPLVILTRLAD